MSQGRYLLMKRCEVIAALEERGLRNRQARVALTRIVQAEHRLHSQARWWRHEVEQFDVLAFLQSLSEDGAGKQGTLPNGGAERRGNT